MYSYIFINTLKYNLELYLLTLGINLFKMATTANWLSKTKYKKNASKSVNLKDTELKFGVTNVLLRTKHLQMIWFEIFY